MNIAGQGTEDTYTKKNETQGKGRVGKIDQLIRQTKLRRI